MKLSNILVVDGSYLLHRVLKQERIFELRTSELERVGGIYGFLQCLQKEIKFSNGYFPIICWDQSHSLRRLSIYDNYKKHKEKLEDPELKSFNEMTNVELDEDYLYQYKSQRKKLIEVLNAFGIPSLLYANTEGDDLAYWLVNHCEKSILISDDSDWLQMLSENCKIRQPMKDRMIFLKDIEEITSCKTTDDFVRLKAFTGDAADNIPNACRMCGIKGAPEFFKLYELLKANNNMNFLKEADEKNLKEYCKNNNIKYKKAYLNFDECQYLNNLELVDLKRIKDEDINEENIYNTIQEIYKNGNMNKVMQLLNKYEIYTVNINVIFENLIMSKYNIKEV